MTMQSNALKAGTLLVLVTVAGLAQADAAPAAPDLGLACAPQHAVKAHKVSRKPRPHVAAARAVRDPLKVEPQISVKQEPIKELDLPGVMKLQGADANLLDPTRVREIHWHNRGVVTVWISDHEVNRIQLPFANPRVVARDVLKIDKRAESNNVYVHYDGAPATDEVWFEPPGQSSVSIGLELVPKDIPGQDVVVLDDTVDSTASRAERAGTQNDYLTRVQALMEQAAMGASPAGFSEVQLQVPPIAVNGLLVTGLRRLSSRGEDLYVYELTNPGPADREVREQEFDGPDVLAVSIVPKPLLKAGERAVLVVLAKKREVQ